MSARGGRGGRGRGGGFPSLTRGGGVQNTPSLAAQMRQVNRLAEPDEMAVFRRFRDMGAVHVRSTYGSTGLLDREVGFPGLLLEANHGSWAHDYGGPFEGTIYLPLIAAENLRASFEEVQIAERARARIPVRLPDRASATWDELSQEERRLCLLSNAEYQRFRARGGNPREVTSPFGGVTLPGKPEDDSSPSGGEPVGVFKDT